MTVGMGARRFFLLGFFAYILLDLGCPFVPGAFSFDPAHSVDAVGAYRARPSGLPSVAPAPATTFDRRLVAPAVHTAGASSTPALVNWRRHAVRDHAAASDPRPSVEDD